MTINHTTNSKQIRLMVESEVNAAGLTLAEFQERATAGSLHDAELRELWLMFKHAFVDCDRS